MASRLAKQIYQSAGINVIEKVKILLGLGSLTQDVTHVLGAIEYLGQDFLKDIKSWNINAEMNDFRLKA